jgi:hypothetical protein
MAIIKISPILHRNGEFDLVRTFLNSKGIVFSYSHTESYTYALNDTKVYDINGPGIPNGTAEVEIHFYHKLLPELKNPYIYEVDLPELAKTVEALRIIIVDAKLNEIYQPKLY